MVLKRVVLSGIAAALIASSLQPAHAAYDPKGRRDPFIPLVGQERPSLASLSDIESIEDVKLEGFAVAPDGKRIAVINGELVRSGDRAGEFEVLEVGKKSVKVSISGKTYDLTLPEEGGR